MRAGGQGFGDFFFAGDLQGGKGKASREEGG